MVDNDNDVLLITRAKHTLYSLSCYPVDRVGLYCVSVFPYNCTGLGSPTGPKYKLLFCFFNAKKTLTSFGSHDLWLRGGPLCGAVPKRDSASVAVCETWCECKMREIFQQGVAMLFGSSGCVRHQCDIVRCFVWYLFQWTSQSPTFRFDIFYLFGSISIEFPKQMCDARRWIT